MQLNKNHLYKIVYKTNLYFNNIILSNLYLPLLNPKSFCLYSYLFSWATTSFDFSNDKKIDEILLMLNMTEEEFNSSRNNLEALNLLKSFFDINSNSVYFEICEPLNFESFVSNKKLYSLLCKTIPQKNFEKIQILLENSKIPNRSENISESINSFFKDKNIDKIYNYNFDELYSKLSSATSLSIFFSKKAKDIIDFFITSTNGKISLIEVEKIIFNTIIKEKENFIVCENLLENELSKLANPLKNINIFQYEKINRNKNIFLNKFDISDLHSIFNDYERFNSEQYFSNIIKCDINKDEKEIIDNLRNKFYLADFIINIMIDFSLNKTYGKLNKTYLFKMAKSFNASSISSLNDAYDFLITKPSKPFFMDKNKKTDLYDKNNYNENKGFETLEKDFFEEEIVSIKW